MFTPSAQPGGDRSAALVATALANTATPLRAPFLKELLAHVAAGLVLIEGEEAAAEAVYRLADAVVSRGKP